MAAQEECRDKDKNIGDRDIALLESRKKRGNIMRVLSVSQKLCLFFDNTISYIHDEGIVNQYNLAVSYTFLLLKFFINFALFLMTR